MSSISHHSYYMWCYISPLYYYQDAFITLRPLQVHPKDRTITESTTRVADDVTCNRPWIRNWKITRIREHQLSMNVRPKPDTSIGKAPKSSTMTKVIFWLINFLMDFGLRLWRFISDHSPGKDGGWNLNLEYFITGFVTICLKEKIFWYIWW